MDTGDEAADAGVAPVAHTGALGRLERWLHRVGARLLSQSGLRVLVLIATVAAIAVNAATMPALYGAVVPLSLAVAVLQAVSLVWALNRPRFAVGTATVAAMASVALTVRGHADLPWPITVVTLVVLALLVFILAVRHRWRVPVLGAVLPLLGAGITGAPWAREHPAAFAINLVTAAAFLALAVTFGILVHQWLRSRAELLKQQERTVAEQERRLLVEERNRIARELHDVVAHGLSVISIQASTLQYRLDDVPADVVDEMEDITSSARSALTEMRGLLAVLRQDDAAVLAPQPTMAALPDLINNARRSADVHLEVTGNLDAAGTSEATSLSVYRIVQEALSNALRHAPGSRVVVRISVTIDHVGLEVENTAGTGTSAAVHGDGFGLRGMRERAGFLGGQLQAHPTDDGGFVVRAVLPNRQPGENVRGTHITG